MSDPTQRFAGRVVNNSRSTNAPGVRMGSFRFIRNHAAARFLGQVCLFIAFVCFPAGVGGMFLVEKSGSRPLEILGGFLVVVANLTLLVGLAAGLMLALLCRKMATIYREALLTPGVIVSVEPLAFAALANMSTGGEDHPAVQRFRLDRLPAHPHAAGTRFPCVAFFQAGERRDAWGDFTAEPLCFATGDRAVLDGRMAAIDPADFARLEAAIAAGEIPDEPKEVRFLDDEPE